MPSAAAPPFPSDRDLRKLLRFSRADGRIWLAGQRMLMMHVNTLQAMRKEIIQSLGCEEARKLLMRAGYASGEQDGLLARQVRSSTSNLFEAFSVGPQLHMLEGAVQVQPRVFEYVAHRDPLRSHFLGIFDWHNSWEAEAHQQEYGTQHEVACWMLLGYASGYSSAFFQQPVLFKETQCTACGHGHCHIEGRFIHEWPDPQALQQDYGPAPTFVVSHLSRDRAASRLANRKSACGRIVLIGQSPAFEHALHLLEQAAPTQVTVLLTGETGVGKEQFAQALHAMSERASKPFVAINCAALPAELIESELFGVEKGAYTGAQQSRAGRFERADGGTLFLDELGELPLTAQAKLLRVLQFGEVEKLGGTATRKVDVRIVAATNMDLRQAVEAGTFRRDLLYRLNIYPVHIPPLRERREDIPLLAQHLLDHYMNQHGKSVMGFTARALSALRNHDWQGNVRELGNLIERGVILTAQDQPIDVCTMFPQLAAPLSEGLAASGVLESAHDPVIQFTPQQPQMTGNGISGLYQLMQQNGLGIQELEALLLQEALTHASGNMAAAARALKLTRPQLSYRLSRIHPHGGGK